ncbi:type VII secretion protein EsaA [Virgibacillus sp. 179-BFC.A HS]|uniref:Type VII secretion system accessory factor EsaA n=1 Tax=Tigheibacillus jepli TaxID=3035914 RepID=A0ABU5CFR1_9BACI|nr:type VII secretion protein EsaA [Virgibacillus sp. 179-BFC.A HS]MDY0404684.1 type VII secretion protein EsaA [Virgibacillus sp. 179-BFC.A HS]
MNKDWKATTGMIVKIMVILALPLLLFRYVESQPIVKVADEPKQETKSVAIVNEDNGLTLNDNVLKLGSEIPLLLKEQKDYSWTVVDRSTAEKGLSSKKYDAVIYIPSNFSLDVMTFKENRPTKATVRYVIQPNLDAKNRQRVHKEMAVAKNKINEEMSKMYWDYVAQEIDHIRDNFDKILEKEVDFQNAMYSFYSPSSKTLAEEIKRQKNQLENILNQTDTVHSVSTDSVDRAAESEKEVKQFADALDAYQQLQLKQKQLWGEFQLGNRKSIDEGIAAYNKALQNAVQSIDEQIQSYDSLAYKQDENTKEIKDNLEFIAFELQNGRDAVFAKDDPKNRTVLEGQLFQMNKTLLASYNNSLLEGSFSKLANASGAIKNNSGKENPPEIDIPEVDEPGDGEEIDLDELQANAQALRNAVNQVKASANTTEAPVAEKPATDKEDAAEGTAEGSQDAKGESNADAAVGHTKGWKQVESSLNGLDNTISKLQSKAGKQRTDDWEKYASDMNKAYRELQTTANEVSEIIADNILNAQAQIEQNMPEYNKYDQLGDITKRLEGVFLTESQLENQDTALLLAYSQALSTFTMILDKSSKEFEENLVHLLNGKEMKKSKEISFPPIRNTPNKWETCSTSSLVKIRMGQKKMWKVPSARWKK